MYSAPHLLKCLPKWPWSTCGLKQPISHQTPSRGIPRMGGATGDLGVVETECLCFEPGSKCQTRLGNWTTVWIASEASSLTWPICFPPYSIPIWNLACLVTQSCPTLWDPLDCSPPGASVHGILHARILEWVAISFSRGSSWPRDQTQVSCICRQVVYHWVTREALGTWCPVLTSVLVHKPDPEGDPGDFYIVHTAVAQTPSSLHSNNIWVLKFQCFLLLPLSLCAQSRSIS